MKISKEAKALIKSMLDRNPARRVTAEAAMNNPWTNQCSHSEPLGQDALMNM
jgi:serine/threonine protein kinase